jgi:protein-tyrosine-phosphatase
LIDVLEVSDPGLDVPAALDDIKRLANQLINPIIMPLDDASLWLVNELSKTEDIRVAGATGEPAEIALDKRRQIELAKMAGFHVPTTTSINRVQDLLRVESFPQIIKPALAAREVDGRLVRGTFGAVADTEERARLATALDFREPYLAQPMIRGVGEGVFGLAFGDRVTHWSGHRRVRMMNPTGSGSSACEPKAPDLAAQQCTSRFLKEIGWTGLFMVELLRDDGGKIWFMELNGRPWGSMALARHNGFEYPAWAVRRLLDDRFEPPQVSHPQKVIVCRHLGRELLHVASVFRGPRSKTYTRWPSRMATLRSVFQLRRNHVFYNWRRGDTRVFWADTWNTLRSVLLRRKRQKSSLLKRLTRRLARIKLRWEQAGYRRDATVHELIGNANSILFVCYGNINRSALAEQYLRSLVPDFEGISSCGFHVPDGRPADPAMCRLAREHGIDLADWASKTIDDARVAEADVILAMEATHLVRLREEFPSSKDRSFLLSCVAETKELPLEIRDPFGKSESDYRRCIGEVTEATRRLTELMKS